MLHLCPGTLFLQASSIQPGSRSTATPRGLTRQSHQTAKGDGSRVRRRPTFPPPSAWKRRKDEIWICLRCESSTRALFVCLAGPSIDLSLRLGGRSIAGLRAKANTLHLLGVGSKRPATASCETVTRMKGWMEADVRRGSVSLRSLECQMKQFTVQA